MDILRKNITRDSRSFKTMARWWLCVTKYEQMAGSNGQRFMYQSKRSLVNVKFKWVKDRVLDNIVSIEKDLKAACTLVSILSSAPDNCLPVYHISRHRGQLGIPEDLKVSTFIRRYPTVFKESYCPDSGGTCVPWFNLTQESFNLHQEELKIIQECKNDLVSRLRKLLMLTKDGVLPLQTIDQLKWDLGLRHDYWNSLVPHYPDLFSLIRLQDDRVGLKHLKWDKNLAVSHFEKSKNGDGRAFRVGFTRGFGLKRKWRDWLQEWQKLPYTSPYTDSASHLDPRTDLAEKRIVGVFHELLNLFIQKKTERKNVSNLRKSLELPQKFTKVFGRHPGIFYISKKLDTQTVVLREGYDGATLIEKHPLINIRERYVDLMRRGMLQRSKGWYKKQSIDKMYCSGIDWKIFKSEVESDYANLSDYESDDNFVKSLPIADDHAVKLLLLSS